MLTVLTFSGSYWLRRSRADIQEALMALMEPAQCGAGAQNILNKMDAGAYPL